LQRHVEIGGANNIAINRCIITWIKSPQPEAIKVVVRPEIVDNRVVYVVDILKLLEVGGVGCNLKFI
jgi:hypothetical protein